MHLETARLILYPMSASQLRQAARICRPPGLPGVVQSFGAHMEPLGFWEMWKRRRVYRAKRTWIEHSPGAWLITTSWLVIRKSDRKLMGEAGF